MFSNSLFIITLLTLIQQNNLMSEPLKLDDVAFLQSELAQDELILLGDADLSEAQTLSLLTTLRQKYAPHEAGILLAQARLRQRATTKFGDHAHKMIFDAQALEQASHPLLREYRAMQIHQYYAPQSLLDAGCGIGSDALSFAQNIEHVVGIDKDRVRIALARHNAQQQGRIIEWQVADIRTIAVDTYDAIFFDPARRHADGKRIFDVEQYHPPLSLVQQWRTTTNKPIIIKLAPGVDHGQLAPYGGLLEFVSVDGDLKEAVLWLDTTPTLRTRATLLQEDKEPLTFESDQALDPIVTEPREWLIEPDPAIIRAGLVRQFAQTLHATQLHPDIAYLTSETMPQTAFVRAWHIRTWLPYNIKKLRRYLHENNIGTVTVKKRGMPITPDAFIKELKLKNGDASCTLVLTRWGDKRIIIVCDDIAII
jgi:SAM-dependent methyltransferase